MSLVYITCHNENIQDIEKQAVLEKHYKFPKYVSIHKKSVKDPPVNQEEEKGKKVISVSYRYSHKTMGYAETPADEPSKYLKKNCGIKCQKIHDHVCPPRRGLPPVPKLNEIPKKKPPKKVNFIKRNVKRMKAAKTGSIPYKYVDTVFGETHNLKGTGLEPEYVYHKAFGKSPGYLKSLKKKMEENKCSKLMEEKDTPQGFRVMTDSERSTILTGLRANYTSLEKTYQMLPLFTDTNPKKQRKTKMEQELKRLEQDILLIDSNPVIFICEE